MKELPVILSRLANMGKSQIFDKLDPSFDPSLFIAFPNALHEGL